MLNFVEEKMENGIAKLVISLCLTLVTTIAMGQLSAPVFACTSVNAAGAITLTWSQPADPGGIFAGYELYEYNVGTGASSLITTITNYNTTSFTIPGYNGNTGTFCFFLQTDATGANPTSGPSEIICNMNLSASAAVTPGIVELSWNFPFITDPAAIGGDFTIFMEYPAGTWSIIETLPYAPGNNLYNYEVNICAGVLNFQIRHTTGGLCNSFSNIDGGAFSDQIDPTAPVITSVDVDSLTNNATISWAPPAQPDVAGYIVYLCVSGLNATPIQTIFDPNITSWTNPNSMADVFPENYNIAAFDGCFTAGQPDPGAANLTCTNTVFLATQWASCTDFVNLNWLPFEGWPNGVDHYNVYAREEVIPGSGIFNPSYLLATIPGDITTYTHQNAPLGSTMYYRVEAFASGLPYTAGSNTRLLTLAYPTPPQFTYISHATVNSETEVEIKVKLDPTVTNPHTYELQRLDKNFNTYEPIAQSTQVASNEIIFFDNDVDTSEESYTYRVLVTNNCGDSIATSNIGKTILTSGLANTHRLVNTVFWTNYEDWDQGVDEYQVFRRIDGEAFPSLVTTMPAGVGFFEDDVSSLLYTEGEFCYTIVALENPNTFSFPDASISNEICLTQEPVIWIPNAFVVNGYNNIFLPVISFADFDNYKMEIYSRWGGVIFQSDDIAQGWDGTYNGELVPEGLYAYFISVSDGAGRIFEERGTLTLLISGID
jgi:gliding motility-associated-like protein